MQYAKLIDVRVPNIEREIKTNEAVYQRGAGTQANTRRSLDTSSLVYNIATGFSITPVYSPDESGIIDYSGFSFLWSMLVYLARRLLWPPSPCKSRCYYSLYPVLAWFCPAVTTTQNNRKLARKEATSLENAAPFLFTHQDLVPRMSEALEYLLTQPPPLAFNPLHPLKEWQNRVPAAFLKKPQVSFELIR